VEAPAVAYSLLDWSDMDNKWINEAAGLALEECKALLREREHFHFRGSHCTPTPLPEPGRPKAGELVQPEPPKAAVTKTVPAKRVVRRQQRQQPGPFQTLVSLFTGDQ
jgi:hypothetical protein